LVETTLIDRVPPAPSVKAEEPKIKQRPKVPTR
jgi:hypothetical protein